MKRHLKLCRVESEKMYLWLSSTVTSGTEITFGHTDATKTKCVLLALTAFKASYAY
jgi:hypothetical protein